MQEIKFRSWNARTQELTTPCAWVNSENLMCYSMSSAPTHQLMQYTGIKDKNGVEIYFNDIVSAQLCDTNGKNLGDFVGKVSFSEFEIQLEMEDERFPLASWLLVQSCEVIGNIYENPKLVDK